MPATLPVYEVTQVGIADAQVKKLAGVLGIPADKMMSRDGIVSFLDPARYLAVPTVTGTNLDEVESRRKGTKNYYPEIPIVAKAIDYAALAKLSVLDSEKALKSASDAFESAGLIPQHARPVVGHTVFKTVSTGDGGAPRSTTTNLDTHVRYRLTLDGYLLVGPGAQVQVSYGADGSVTRLFYSMRTLKQGPWVKILSPDAVRARFAKGLPDDAEIELNLVYWSPPLRPGVKSAPGWNPREIIPWYAVTVTRRLVDPSTQSIQTKTSRVHLVPATDDSRFVPTVTLTAEAPQRSQVNAHATAMGGTPPYTYLWAGSNPDASAGIGDSVSYAPVARDFRGVLPAQSMERVESVSVTVIDANGVPAQAGRSVPVVAQPAPGTSSSITYGCESPNDPGPSGDGSYSPERIAWQQGMGQAGAGGGSQRFCWLEDSSWPGDYIEPTPAGTLVADPWINGDADYSNWGINSTNIMLYNGDGNPWGFAEMFPGATLMDYNTSGGAGLSAPGSTDTVSIGSMSYAVNYNGAWGCPNPNDNLQWLAMYACEILEDDSSAPSPWLRWGPAFNGLHSLLGFESDASDAGVGFMTDFPANILGISFPIIGYLWQPETIVQGWLNAALGNDMGTPAAMGPIWNVTDTDSGQTFGFSDYSDYYWGKGDVGLSINQSIINGWWYIQGTDAVQYFP